MMYNVFSYKGETYKDYDGIDALLLEVMVDLATVYGDVVGAVNAIYHEDTEFVKVGVNQYVNTYDLTEGIYTLEEIKEIYSDFFDCIFDVVDFSETADIDTIKVIDY